MSLTDLVRKLSNKKSPRTEADIQADVRHLLLEASLDLKDGDLQDIKLESPLGDRRRIDVELGATVIEVKKDLRKGNVLEEATEQLQGYVETRIKQTGQNYVGILTDGAEWLCFQLNPVHGFLQVSDHLVNTSNPDSDALVLWLDGVLATKKGTKPIPSEIESRLGSSSSSYAVDRATLSGLYEQFKTLPTVQMKRTLWAKLLTTALGSQFKDSDDLFVEHTLLVNSSEIIAHTVLGFDVNLLSPKSLLSGAKFEESGIYGVVESDFFDWVLEISEGEAFVRSLARKIGRFDWQDVSYDIMKVLYESIIAPEIRKQLGEYYTPDWLAQVIVEKTIDNPLENRVLDSACGSGTFLFHAIRLFLNEADKTGMSSSEALARVTKNVIGFDIHPVAITLARVTYLLAIGRKRLIGDRKELTIPVYLGDSMQWQQKPMDLFSANDIVIATNDGRELVSSELRFPLELLKDSRVFDELIKDLANRAATAKPQGKLPSLKGLFQRLAINPEFQQTIETTFKLMCELHLKERDHIWGYYVRNLVRPAWLERPENRVDRLIGNPPWLSYRFMPPGMQVSFKEMSQTRNLWHGAKMATHQDLSALFVAKTIQMYLKEGGKFGFVMPNPTIDRDYYSGFRGGSYPGGLSITNVQFETPWDLRRIRPHIFPRGSSVIFGTRSKTSKSMPHQAEIWKGSLHKVESRWSEVEPIVSRNVEKLSLIQDYESPYRSRFLQGATIVPKMLFVVEEKPVGPLGIAFGKKLVKSKRSAYEKDPWKDLSDLEGAIESEFVRPIYSGQTIVPFRVLIPDEVIIPWDSQVLLSDHPILLEQYPGLSEWWKKSEKIWLENRSSDRLNLTDRINYRNTLIQQFPIQLERIVYATSGMHICAARISDRRGIIDSKLYWATASSQDEGHYLLAILNANFTTQKTRPLMSYGKDERDIHKHVWKLNIPLFNPQLTLHREIAQLGRQIEKMVAALELRDVYFSAIRKDIRKFVKATDEGKEIEKLVKELIG